MSMRRFISLLAALGVLCNAAAIAHHNGLRLATVLQLQSLLDPTSICHGSGRGEAPTQSPAHPQESDCPICKGLAPVAALIASANVAAQCPPTTAIPYGHWTEAVADFGHAVRPQTRAPPARA